MDSSPKQHVFAAREPAPIIDTPVTHEKIPMDERDLDSFGLPPNDLDLARHWIRHYMWHAEDPREDMAYLKVEEFTNNNTLHLYGMRYLVTSFVAYGMNHTNALVTLSEKATSSKVLKEMMQDVTKRSTDTGLVPSGAGVGSSAHAPVNLIEPPVTIKLGSRKVGDNYMASVATRRKALFKASEELIREYDALLAEERKAHGEVLEEVTRERDQAKEQVETLKLELRLKSVPDRAFRKQLTDAQGEVARLKNARRIESQSTEHLRAEVIQEKNAKLEALDQLLNMTRERNDASVSNLQEENAKLDALRELEQMNRKFYDATVITARAESAQVKALRQLKQMTGERGDALGRVAAVLNIVGGSATPSGTKRAFEENGDKHSDSKRPRKA